MWQNVSLSKELLVESSREWEVDDDRIVDGQSTHYPHQLEVVETPI